MQLRRKPKISGWRVFLQPESSYMQSRLWHAIAIMLCLSAIAADGDAAGRKQWVTLGDCRYVDAEYNDGDSFRVRCGDKEFNLRLYFVDAPETKMRYGDRVLEQSKHFGVTLDEALRAGDRAKDRVRDLLRGPFSVQTREATAGGGGKAPRYYALVEVGGKRLEEILVAEGLARTKGIFPNLPSGEKGKAYRARLEALEDAAHHKRLGVWASTMTR
jgi:endonuclease YncB( thermonuclease family)